MALNFIQRTIQNIVTYAFPAPKDFYEEVYENRRAGLDKLLEYYNGAQRKPLRLTSRGVDYNIITNHTRTIVDRSVSMLMGNGVTFDLPGEGETPQDELLTRVWDANKRGILLHDLAQFGSVYGTMALKIIPDGVMGIDGVVTYRLVALNPYNLSVINAPDDMSHIVTYIYRWNAGDTAWREVTAEQENGTWLVTVQKADKSTHNRWENQSEVAWPYSFAPIAHGKNLPSAGSVYGYSDIEGIIDLQDKYNESQSNINKILSLQAASQKYLIGAQLPKEKDDKGGSYINGEPGSVWQIANENAKIGILAPVGDMASSVNFVNSLRRDMYDIAATVDSESMTDKVGALTNFGLHVLFKNELAKNATKQLLYGDLLCQVNNRLLQLAGYSGAEADPGVVIWSDGLPENDTEEVQTLQAEIAMGIRSKEGAASARGIDWESEQERLLKEKQAAGNVGANMIRDFLAGRNNGS